jgi:hypothetical protein
MEKTCEIRDRLQLFSCLRAQIASSMANRRPEKPPIKFKETRRKHLKPHSKKEAYELLPEIMKKDRIDCIDRASKKKKKCFEQR